MPSKTLGRGRPKKTARRNRSLTGVGPHFMPVGFGSPELFPGPGFEGKFFIEAGLDAGMAAARNFLNESLTQKMQTKGSGQDSIRSSFIASTTAFTDTTARLGDLSQAGIRFTAINEVPSFASSLNIKKELEDAFQKAIPTAKSIARRTSDKRSGKYSPVPWGEGGKRASLRRMIDYKVHPTSGGVAMRFNVRGSSDDAEKLFAQNYGLRGATAAETDEANRGRTYTSGFKRGLTTGGNT